MLPSDSMRKKLEAKGLVLRNRFGSVAIMKPMEITGNSLPDYQSSHMQDIHGQGGIASDCPMIEWSSRKERIRLSHWAYVPGPGPGDFEEEFDTEEDAVDFILSYFFGDNPFFQAKVVDQMHRRESYNLEEVAAITDEVLRLAKELFGDKEFTWDRGSYYRLPVDQFWILEPEPEPEPEFPSLTGETGFMGYTLMMLRRKVHEGRRLTAKEVSTVADIFRHISLVMKQVEETESNSG